nr:restriction endonuclease subunit S [Paenibacillus sp. ACRRX]
MQWSISMILEAKAMEAEKSRNWMLNHFTHQPAATPHEQIEEALEIHEQVIEVLEGLTKLQQGLARNMKTIFHRAGSGGHGDGISDGAFGEFELGDRLQ